MERYKILVQFEKDEDGRLRVWSPDVPGFLLSNRNHEAVLADIAPALETILGERLGRTIRVLPLQPLAERDAPPSYNVRTREYVSEPVAA